MNERVGGGISGTQCSPHNREWLQTVSTDVTGVELRLTFRNRQECHYRQTITMCPPRRIKNISDTAVQWIELGITRPDRDGGLVASEDTGHEHRPMSVWVFCNLILRRKHE
jgi:hypothetical protein